MQTREELNGQLWELVRRAQAMEGKAREAVRNGSVCSGTWWGHLIGDEAACNTLIANSGKLNERVLKLAERVGTIVLLDDAELTQEHVDDLTETSELISSEAANLADAAQSGSFLQFARDVIRQFAEFIGAVVREAVEIAVDVGTEAVKGILDGLGLVGTLVVGLLIFELVKARTA